VREIGARAEVPVAIVQDQERSLLTKRARERVEQRPLRLLAHPGRGRDAWKTRASSRIGARSVNQTPSGKSASTLVPTSTASRVFPHPPAPVKVRRRVRDRRPRHSATSAPRPMKLVPDAGRLFGEGERGRRSGSGCVGGCPGAPRAPTGPRRCVEAAFPDPSRAAREEASQARRNAVRQRRPPRFSGQDRDDDILRGLPLVRTPPREALEENAAEREEVRPAVLR